MHPNGYQGPGLDYIDSTLEEGYQPERAYPKQKFIPGESAEGAPFLPGRRSNAVPGETYIEEFPLDVNEQPAEAPAPLP